MSISLKIHLLADPESENLESIGTMMRIWFSTFQRCQESKKNWNLKNSTGAKEIFTIEVLKMLQNLLEKSSTLTITFMLIYYVIKIRFKQKIFRNYTHMHIHTHTYPKIHTHTSKHVHTS